MRNPYIKHIVIVFLIILLGQSLNAQYQNIYFERFGTQDGLSNNSVTGIIQDNNGFIWLSTEIGLNRFDGSHFVNFYSDPEDSNSLCNNLIWNIFYDSKGLIWLTTQNGLSIFNPETEQFTNFFHDPEDSTSISHSALLSVTEDLKGNIWIGTSNGDINRYNPQNQNFTHFKVPRHGNGGFRPNYVVDLLTDQSGKIWIGMYDGFSIFDPETNEFIPLPDSNIPGEFHGTFIRSLFEDSKSNIWIGTSDRGFSKYDPINKKFKHYGEEKIKGLTTNSGYHIAEDNQGRIWLGTYLDGLFILDPKTEKVVSYKSDDYDVTSLSHNSINSIFKDSYGTMWIGTYGNDLNLYNPNQTEHEYHKHNPEKNTLNNSLIRRVHEDSNKDLWIHSGSVLQRYNRESNMYKNYSFSDSKNKINSDRIYTFHNDKKGNLWLGTNGGINFKKKFSDKFESIHLTKDQKKSLKNSVQIFLEDKNTLWIGTEDGLNSYNFLNKTIKRIDVTENLTINCIAKLTNDSEKFLLGTRSGVYIYNQKLNQIKKVKSNLETVLTISSFYKVNEDEYWLAGNLGFIKYTPTTNKINVYSPSLVNLSALTSYYYSNGKLFAGNSNGFFYFDKEKDSFKQIHIGPKEKSFGLYDVLDGNNHFLILVAQHSIYRFNVNTFEFKIVYFNKMVTKAGFSILCNLKLNSGELFLGGDKFFLIYNPTEKKSFGSSNKLKITDLFIGNQRITTQKTPDERTLLHSPIYKTNLIELEYYDMPITINYSEIDYTNFQKGYYRFQLKGIDNELSAKTKLSSITYRIIPPGEYKFWVTTSEKNNFDSLNTAYLDIIIRPPFYSSTWFKILIFILSLSVLFTGYKFRVNFIKARNKELRSYNEQLNLEIKERKRAEQAATESEKKYRTLFSSIADPILIFDTSTKYIIECNERAISEFGYTKNELTKMKVFDLHPENELQKVNANLADKNNSGPNYYTYIKKDGSQISVEVHSEFLVYEQKSAWISIIRDVTEKIKAEQKLEKLNKSLDLKNQELEQIIYVSSHDLRTPLVNIQGFSSEIEMDLAELKIKYPENKELIENIINNTFSEPISFIKENTTKMDLLLNGLARFSRLGRDELSYEFINTTVLVQSVISSLRHLMKNQEIEIQIGILPKFYGDLELIKQVFSPLIENAILYREKSRKTIIKIDGFENNLSTRFSIQDNGIGIAEAHQKIIFEIFHKLNPYSSEGVGLGLTFASKIVQAHNGEMNIKSKLGEGSTFSFTIPKK